METDPEQHVSNLENPRFTERTSTNLGRSHRLPHMCTIMIYGKLGGYRLQESVKFYNIYIYIYIFHRNQRPIWVSQVWILEKYNDITLKRGIANLGRSHRLPCFLKQFPSISINQCPSNTYLVLPGFCVGSCNHTYAGTSTGRLQWYPQDTAKSFAKWSSAGLSHSLANLNNNDDQDLKLHTFAKLEVLHLFRWFTHTNLIKIG